MDTFAQIAETSHCIRRSSNLKPSVGVILGSGLSQFTDVLANAVHLPYQTLPHFPVGHVAGHKGELVVGNLGKINVAVLSGRAHFYEGVEPECVGYGVRLLKALGVSNLIVTNAAGGINTAYEPGDLMVISDHINLTGHSPLRGQNDERLGPRFPDLSQAYDRELRLQLVATAKKQNVKLWEGIYAGVMGPAYETPAEIRMLRTLGADAVGMSTVFEVIVARHSGVKVLGLSLITNPAAGHSDKPLSHHDVRLIAEKASLKFCELLKNYIENNMAIP